MSQSYNIYCDESCHLEHDSQPVMVLGAIWCTSDGIYDARDRIREIKQRHRLPVDFEIKWTKVSPAGVMFYRDLVDYFFDDDDLHFRALVVPDKSRLDHPRFDQDHDTWYYKMYFSMLKAILRPNAAYRIFLDIKDTRSAAKVRKLREILANDMYDFSKRIITSMQTIRSCESELLQLADLLVGAVMAANRGTDDSTSPAKRALVDRIRERSGYRLTKTTLVQEPKFNVFVWHASGGGPQ